MIKNAPIKYKYIVKSSENPEDDTVLVTEEHYISATELAAFLDIYYTGCRIVNAKLAKKIAAKVLFNYPEYYYKTGNGYNMRVYPNEHALCIVNYIFDNLKITEVENDIINFSIDDSKCSTFKNSALGKLILDAMEKEGECKIG